MPSRRPVRATWRGARLFRFRRGAAVVVRGRPGGPRSADELPFATDALYNAPVLRQGSGEPLVLLHGILGSERMWSHVVPLLADHHDVIAPTMLGHRGGAPATMRPARLEHVVDDAQRLLDELGLEQVHLAGNS